MDREDHILLAVHITDRIKHASQVQEQLTQYGCNIKTRLGLHEADANYCSPNGMIILEMVGDETLIGELHEGLNGIEGVEAKKVVFTHPAP